MIGEGCVFCQIGRGERPAQKVYEDGHFLAFLDIYPVTPGHTLVIPRAHYRSLTEMPEEEVAEYFKVIARLAGRIKKAMEAQGFNLGLNDGSVAGQAIFHVHVHIIPRYRHDRGIGVQGVVRAPVERGKFDEIASKIRAEVAEG